MKARTADILSALFIAAAAALAAALYTDLPAQIPTHWNAAGEIDDYSPKGWGIVMLLGMGVLVWVIMKLIPVISPKGYRTETFAEIVNLFQVVLVAFMSGICMLVLLESYGINVRINESIFIGVGLLLFILGNYMTKMRKNFFLGIRTPWTLASDEVWSRTHRVGGPIFMAGGLLLVISAFLPIRAEAMATVIVIIALVPVVYSYFVYRSVEGFTEDSDEGDSA
jgi:uncharacterized membrane protein